MARLAQRLRLSNAEQAVLALAAEWGWMSALPDETAAKAALYRLGRERLPVLPCARLGDSGAAPDDPHWRLACALPERWQAPTFPLRGADLMALGELKGPEIGETLRRLEQDWIAGGFGLTREQLLAKARALIAERR